MRILIIGGCGYIGSALYKGFKKYYSYTTAVDSIDTEWFGKPASVHNVKTDYALFPKEHLATYDVIILAAAHSSVPMCQQDRFGAYKNNVDKFVSLVDTIESARKPIKLIYASSSCVYVETKDRPAVETDALSPVDVLSYTKTAIDQYAAISNVEYYGLRFGSVCGWSDNFRSDLMVNAMTYKAVSTGKLTVSNGESYRPILSMHTLVQTVRHIVESEQDKRGVYNVLSFNAKIGDVAKEIAKMTKAEIVYGEDSKTYNFCIDNSKFLKAYPEFKHTHKETLETIVSPLIGQVKDNLKTDFIKREMRDELYCK